MKIQSLVFPEKEICTKEGLYFRKGRKSGFDFCEKVLNTTKGETIGFDTYFNGCSAEKWFKYTRIKKISLVLNVSGKFRITLMQKQKTANDSVSKEIGSGVFGSDGKAGVYTFVFNTESKKGMYCFELKSLSENGKIFGGYYDGETEGETEKVKLAVVICTFKREEFILRNVRLINESLMSNSESGMKDRLEIFISDNAKSLKREDVVLNENIHLFKNKNTGGAGGFTRGMIEVMKCRKKSGITHILIMDDDVVVNPESVYRTFAIFSLLKEEYRNSFIGGAMLRLDSRYIQTESGALWNKGLLISRKKNLNLLKLNKCLFNETEEETDYNAWWYCAFPESVVNEENLPLPIFIRGDDVEYGLRNMKNLILMNGICVWHEPFDKKYSSSMYYYIFRNRLIDNSIHNLKYRSYELLYELYSAVRTELVRYRFKNAELIMEGISDFLKGIDWLKEQDGEQLNISIMKRGYQLVDLDKLEIPFSYEAYRESCRKKKAGFLKKVIRRLSINGVLLPCRREKDGDKPIIVSTYDPRFVSLYRTRKSIHFDRGSQKAFVTEKKFKEVFHILIRLLGLSFKILFKYNRVSKQYEKRGKELMTLEFWEKYLNI